jgi:F-type H+-transporting ATPase subunit alpha
MVEILKQPQFKPMNVIDQVLIIFAGTKGFLDKVERRKVLDWQDRFLTFMREQRAEVRAELVKARKLSPDLEAKLVAAIQAFQPQFKG